MAKNSKASMPVNDQLPEVKGADDAAVSEAVGATETAPASDVVKRDEGVAGDRTTAPDGETPKPVEPSAEFVAPSEDGEDFKLEAESESKPGYLLRDGIVFVDEPCPKCGGSGTVKCKNPDCTASHKCPECRGTGKRRLNNTEQIILMTLQSRKASVMTHELATISRSAVTTARVVLGRLADFGLIERVDGKTKAESAARIEWKALDLVETPEDKPEATAGAPAAE